MTQYHVTLNAQGYVLDLDRYARRIRDPFVPRQGQGSVAVDDLRGPEQVLVISDWSDGEGFVQHSPEGTGEDHPGRYRSGSGIDGYSVPGTLRLGPDVSTVGTTSADQVRSMAVYKSKLYLGCTASLIYSWDGTTFAQPHTLPGAVQVVSLATFLGVLYAGNDTNGHLLSFDGTTWTDTAATAGGAIRSLLTHYRQAAQYLYLGARGAGTGGIGRIYYWDGAALSLGQFDPEEELPEVMLVLGEKLYIGAVDSGIQSWSLYSVDDSGSGGSWRRHVARLVGYPSGAAILAGVAYIGDGLNPRLYRWDGSGLRVELDGVGRDSPFTTATQSLSTWRGAVWFGALDTNSTGAIFRYDGSSLFRVATGLAGTGFGASGVFADRLYFGSIQTGAAKLFKIDPTLYGGSGTLTSGLITFGLPGISKLLRSVTLVTAALPSGQSVQVEYQLEDTGAWTSLGTFSTTGGTLVTYSFPSNTTCRQVALRLTLTGSAGSASSPVIHELAIRYVPRPAITREWDLAVVLEGTPELPLITLDGDAESLTGAQLTSALWTAAGSSGPVTLVDLDGASYAVYVSDVREELAKISQRKGYQRLGLVKLVEAA